MRINAYVMAADPAWIEASISSYYPRVDRIVVAYDENSLSWSGTPLEVGECLERLAKCDPQKKFCYVPGHFARKEASPMDNDTFQRQTALDLAGENADWVIQLDTDEVIADAAAFFSCLSDADQGGFQAMDYPARWLYKQIGPRRYLERCSRTWGPVAGFPGPVAVRPGVRLLNARQCDAPLFRVDFRQRNTDPCHAKNAPVHRVVPTRSGIVHYSWIRDEEDLLRKTSAWGHSRDPWGKEIAYWNWAGRHPVLATLATPFMRFQRRVRPVTIAPRGDGAHPICSRAVSH